MCSEHTAKNDLKCCQIAKILSFYMNLMPLRKTVMPDFEPDIEILRFCACATKNGQNTKQCTLMDKMPLFLEMGVAELNVGDRILTGSSQIVILAHVL